MENQVKTQAEKAIAFCLKLEQCPQDYLCAEHWRELAEVFEGPVARQPEPADEAVAYRHMMDDGWEYFDAPTGDDCQECQPLYTHPPAAAPAPAVPKCVVVDCGFRWESEALQHVPRLVIEFEPVPMNSPNDAKGWKDRNALAAMLAATPTPAPAQEAMCSPTVPDDLPGMWDHSDLAGGETDCTKPAQEVGLTDEEICECFGIDGADDWVFKGARAIIAAIRAKGQG